LYLSQVGTTLRPIAHAEDTRAAGGCFNRHFDRRSIDLVERGVAWQPDARALPAFRETPCEIEDRFTSL